MDFDFPTGSDEEQELFLPDGIGSDVEDHAISSSDNAEGIGTPQMSPAPQMRKFDTGHNIEAVIGSSHDQERGDKDAAGTSFLTSSFLSMPENVRQQDLHVNKKLPPDKNANGGKVKKRTKRKAVEKDDDNKPKKKKKKTKKDGKKDGKKKEKKKKISPEVVTPSERTKRRNIKTFLRQDELEADTLNAQREEEERKKRLEEQRVLNADLATLSELLNDVPTQSDPPPSLEPLLPPLSQPSSSTHGSTFRFPPSAPPPPLSSPRFAVPPALAPMPRIPIPVLTPQMQSQMMKSFPPQFRPFQMGHPYMIHQVPPMMMRGSMPTKPPPRVEDGLIVLDDSSGEEDDSTLKASKDDDIIQISSGDEDITVVSDGEQEDEMQEEEEEEDNDADDSESSGMHTNDRFNVSDAYGRVLVNFNHPPEDPDIFLADHLSRVVKPHQIGGVRFLYDNLVESLERFNQSSGFGCILAHSMGLGKTLQLITFTDIFMRYTRAKTVLCIVPINTLQNWVAEYDRWLPGGGSQQGCGRDKTRKRTNNSEKGNGSNDDDRGNDPGVDRPSLRAFRVFVVNDMHKTMDLRLNVIDEWYTEGGVLLMGYEMYRLLCSRKIQRTRRKPPASRKKAQVIDLEEEDRKEGIMTDIRRALVKPGPDLVICDEGHRIKNSLAGISQALKNIRTRRRVVLTGYPLQNNLQEYWCMVDFVRPNFLGTKHEFSNLFERPISNGQCMDSTPNDVRLMKHRAHVLHRILEGFVQRRGFKVLKTALPPKEEHVLLVRLTTFQRGLYIRFMQKFLEAGAAGWCSTNPLKAFSVACKIWNHPDVLCDVLQTRQILDTDADLDLPDFNPKKKNGVKKKGKGKDGNEKSGGEESGKSSPSSEVAAGAGCRKPFLPESYHDKVNEILSFEWARDLMKNYQQNKISNSSKMVMLFKILEDSIKMGDKILVFTQSLMTLSVIEKFLALTPVPQPTNNPPPDMPTKWIKNTSYFRLDGSTPVSEREKMINQFNNKSSNKLWLFLLSTRAGSLGINLIGANRVVILDASWNPCHDAQAVCRVYRYGQSKRCYIYRMVTDNTLEKKIYDRQISKKGMSDRVVDEMNPEMNLTKKEVESLLEFDESDMPFEDFSHLAKNYADPILKEIVSKYSQSITKAPYTAESVLGNRQDRRLTRAEKRQAESNYEAEKKLNLSYSRPSYASYYGQGGSSSKPRINIDAHAAHASALPSSFMSRYTANRPVANVRPIQSTPVPKTPMSNMQQRLVELRNAGVSVQKIIATTDIILPGTNTYTTSNPLIKTGEQVTFIKTQKGVYLRTTDGRILAVRGTQQAGISQGPSSSGLNLGQGMMSYITTTPQMSSSTVTTSSSQMSSESSSRGSVHQVRHQLADLLSENLPRGDPINLSSDSDPDSDFFDPFKSPIKALRNTGVRDAQDSNRQDGRGVSGSPFLSGVNVSKPATCTVSPGVQSVPLASTLPLRSFGQGRQMQSSQPEVNPLFSNSTTESITLAESQAAYDILNSLSDSPGPDGTTDARTPLAATTSTDSSTTIQNVLNANTSAQQQQQPQPIQQQPIQQQPPPIQQQSTSSYGMPYYPGMVPTMPTAGNTQQQQQQQPPIVINYQLPMPPGTMMPPGAFMPFGFPPMMFNPGSATASGQPVQQQQSHAQQSQSPLQVQPNAMNQNQAMNQPHGQGFQAPQGGQFQAPSGGQLQQGQSQGDKIANPVGQSNQANVSLQTTGTAASSVITDGMSLPDTDLLRQKMSDTLQGSQPDTAIV